MTKSVASWFVPACAALGLMLFAGEARAQFEECVVPSAVPEGVFDTIIEEASFDFGDLSEKVCASITKKGVSTCKSQAKAADKCFRRSLDMVYEINVKQCQQIEDSSVRSECKAGAKASRDNDKDEVKASKDSALSVCDGEFEDALSDNCLNGISM